MMRKKRKTFVFLLVASLMLGACQLQVAPAQSNVTAITQPGSITQPAKDPETISGLGWDEDARTILQKSAEAMRSAESYVYTAESLATFDGKAERTHTSATLFPKRGDGRTDITQNGQITTTYLKNNRMYLPDPLTGRWVYLEMSVEDPMEIQIHERVDAFMEVTRTATGLSLTSKQPLSAFEFYSLTGIEEQEKAALDALARLGQTMTTMVTFELDEAYRYQRVIYEQVTVTGGVSTWNATTYVYSSYDAAQPVSVPQAILDGAVLLEAEAGD